MLIVLAHGNNNSRVDMWLHSDSVSWVQANQYVLFLLYTTWLEEKQKKNNFAVMGLTRPGLESKIYRTRGKHANLCDLLN